MINHYLEENCLRVSYIQGLQCTAARSSWKYFLYIFIG